MTSFDLPSLRRPPFALRVVTMVFAAGGLAMSLSGCIHNPPAVDGVRSTAPTPHDFWKPPAEVLRQDTTPHPAAASTIIPVDLESKIQQLTLTDVIDLALRNNPATRVSWAQARSTAALYGAERAAYFPSLTVNGTYGTSKSITANSRVPGPRTQYGPSLSVSYLLFDFGGRSGSVDAARQAVFAANLTHNATVQDVVLQVAGAYFTYMSTKALLGAQQSTVQEATANLQAAEQRHQVGLATIADVLQAKTALAQAQLAMETTQGNLQAARGALAVAMGLPANAPYDIEPEPNPVPVKTIAASVDSLIAQAIRNRPDLEAARAQVQQSLAQIRVSKSAMMPSLLVTGNMGQTYSNISAFQGNNYAVQLGLSFPLFTGFSHTYDVMSSEAIAQAARSRAEGLEQQVVNQVFTSYYALQTATQRVKTTDVLLSSAEQSEQVARGRYTEGVGSILDLLTAQTALADARAQQVQARWVWYTALAQLAHDTGILGLHGEAPLPFSSDSTDR